MNDNTIIRIRVPKHLYESVKRQLTLLEGKHNLGAGMTPVKEKKSSSDAPKKASAPKKANAPQKATGAMFDKETEKMGAGVSEAKKTPKDGHKKMGLDELKALAEMLKNQISEMEGEEKGKEKVEEAEKFKVGKRDFTYKDKTGKMKYGTADDLDAAREMVKNYGEDENTVRMVEKKQLTKEYNRYDRDEPDEFDPRDYDTSYARSGGAGLSRRDVRRKMSGLYSDDEILAAQQDDAVKMGRIPAPAPKQTPRGKF